MKVTALISAYNGERWMAARLENLLSQTIADQLQIVVVDSGSQQGEGAIVARYPAVEYVRTPRESLYAAWNRAIRMARGSYLTNANLDDRLFPHALETLAAALDEHPEAALVYSDNYETDCHEAGELRRVRRARPSLKRLLLGCVCGPFPMWRRSLHDELGYFDESFSVAGDWEFWLRVAKRYPLLHLEEPLGVYLRNPGGLEHSNAELLLRENHRVRSRHFRSP